MLTFRRIFGIIVVCLIWTAVAFGQQDDSNFRNGNYQRDTQRIDNRADRKHPPRLPDSARIKQMVDELSSELSLTDEQKAKISELHFNHFAEAKKLMAQAEEDHQKNREKMEALRKEFEDSIKVVLNEEQVQKYEEFMKSRGPRPGPPDEKNNGDIKPRKK